MIISNQSVHILSEIVLKMLSGNTFCAHAASSRIGAKIILRKMNSANFRLKFRPLLPKNLTES